MGKSRRRQKLEELKRKTWSIGDISKSIKPMTASQNDMFHAFSSGNNIVASGTAGTGKTMFAVYLALNEVLREDTKQKKIIIVRSAVTTRAIGFTPGDMDEKLAYFEQPYRSIFKQIIGRWSTYDDMKDAYIVEFLSTTHLRGLTFENAIVIFEEAEDSNFHEIDTVITRMGRNSRIIITGDTKQTDLLNNPRDTSGFPKLLTVARRMSSFTVINFGINDILRGPLVKEWISTVESIDNG